MPCSMHSPSRWFPQSCVLPPRTIGPRAQVVTIVAHPKSEQVFGDSPRPSLLGFVRARRGSGPYPDRRGLGHCVEHRGGLGTEGVFVPGGHSRSTTDRRWRRVPTTPDAHAVRRGIWQPDPRRWWRGPRRVRVQSVQFPVLAFRTHLDVDRAGGTGFPSLVSCGRALEFAVQPCRLGAARRAGPQVQGSCHSTERGLDLHARTILAGVDPWSELFTMAASEATDRRGDGPRLGVPPRTGEDRTTCAGHAIQLRCSSAAAAAQVARRLSSRVRPAPPAGTGRVSRC